jgi:PLD-like domain
LLRSDIEVKGDYNPKIFHQKFILRDYDGKASATSALLSGSANFTWTDTHSNLNNLFVFRNAYICRQYQAEVEQLQRGSFGRGLHGEVPRTYDLAGVPVRGAVRPRPHPRAGDHEATPEGVQGMLFRDLHLRGLFRD